ncbi:MAG: hypothetical protein CXR31_09760 [Geobacter sp.]|nr:MAG: hypothetical protein CXR31_09760 [Geobacter sp.]
MRFLFAVALVVLAQGCTKNIETETVKVPPRYPTCTVLTIKTPMIKEDIYKDMDKEERKEFDETTAGMFKAFADSVQERVKEETAIKNIRVYPKEVDNSQDGLILETTFTEIKSGNQGVRFVMTYLVGVGGFGKPRVEVECKLIDAKTGKVLDDKEAEKDSSFRMGKFKDDLAIDYSKDLGRECANLVDEYMQKDLNEL